MAEWPNARDCKSLKPSVRIRPSLPGFGLLVELVKTSACHVEDQGFESPTDRQVLCTLRLSVRTRPFHGRKRSSILLGCTNYTCRSLTTLAPDEKRISRLLRERTRKIRSQTVLFESDGEYLYFLLFRASVTVAHQTPNLLDGVRFPGSEPFNL